MTGTDAAGLSAGAGALGVQLPEARAALLLSYLDAMLAENESVNLTAVRDREQAVVLHALDSLVAGRFDLEPRRVLDLGTGNGFPGLGCGALWPATEVLLMDRTRKKIAAIDRCLKAVGWRGVSTAWIDVSQAPALRPDLARSFDLVTARAIGTPETLAGLADKLVARGGDLLLWLDLDTAAPPGLPGPFALRGIESYSLPEPAPRQRRLARYRRL